MRMAEKSVLLQVLDQIWKEHLLSLDHLRQGIGLRAYAQKDPLNEYKREAFDLFEKMLVSLRETVTMALCHLEISAQDPAELGQYESGEMYETRDDPAFAEANLMDDEIHPAAAAMSATVQPTNMFSANADPSDVPAGWRLHEPLGRWVDPEDQTSWGKVPRNAACPCGSSKKFKHCHGKAA
jgi:preprotein translocase subunit SecA